LTFQGLLYDPDNVSCYRKLDRNPYDWFRSAPAHNDQPC